MGLDMYLVDGRNRDVYYWRKANAIHRWFVENVQGGVDDCQKYRVSRKQLQKLLEDVVAVLKSAKLVPGKVLWDDYSSGVHEKKTADGIVLDNTETATLLLPTQSGFFFGDTNYDEYYWEDLAKTRKALEDILLTRKKVFYYQSSW